MTEGTTARPAFISAPDRNRPVGPPQCMWARIAVGGEPCFRPSRVDRNLILCDFHSREVALRIAYHPLAEARELAVQQVTVELDTLRAENARLSARLAKPAKPQRADSPDVLGTIYYLRSGAHFKIGWTADLEKRMKGYPPDTSLLAVRPGTKADERAIHRRFSHLLSHGREWFLLAPEVQDHVASVVAEHGAPPVVDFTARRANRTVGRQVAYVGGPNRGKLAPRQVRG